MYRLMPTVGSWHQDLETGYVFEVVAVDDATGTIEIQFIDGEVDEYDLESWSELQLVPAAEPEDWCAAYEMNREDRIESDFIQRPENWSGPLAEIEPPLTLSWAEI